MRKYLLLAASLLACSQPSQPTDTGTTVDTGADAQPLDVQTVDAMDTQSTDATDAQSDDVQCDGPEFRVCNGICVHYADDPNNCGVCGRTCSMNNCACSGGQCLVLDASFPQLCQ